MRIYFLDTENIGAAWIDAVLRDDEVGEVVVFYTKNSQPVPLTALPKLGGIWEKLTFVECCIGQNALDFQLSSELGYRVAGAPKDEYVILSRDSGYDAIVKYWQNKDIAVSRHSPEEVKPVVGTATVAVSAPLPAPTEKHRRTRTARPKPAQPAEPGVSKRLADAELSDAEAQVTAILEKMQGINEDQRLTRIYRAFIQSFGQTTGLSIYNAVKPGIKAFYAKMPEIAPKTPESSAAPELEAQ